MVLIFRNFFHGRHVQGICDHLALIMKRMHGLNVDPLTDIAICCGQTEAFAAAIFASMFSSQVAIIAFFSSFLSSICI